MVTRALTTLLFLCFTAGLHASPPAAVTTTPKLLMLRYVAGWGVAGWTVTVQHDGAVELKSEEPAAGRSFAATYRLDAADLKSLREAMASLAASGLPERLSTGASDAPELTILEFTTDTQIELHALELHNGRPRVRTREAKKFMAHWSRLLEHLAIPAIHLPFGPAIRATAAAPN
jgi:hypothetical protein